MKTIADFKRAMTPGSFWKTTHKYINNNPTPPKDMGIRECGHVQSNSFAFKTDRGTLSWCNWPKKGEFSTDGESFVIRNEFCELRYAPVNEAS